MRRFKRFVRFVKDVTATEYVSDDDDNEIPVYYSKQTAQHNVQNEYSTNTTVTQSTYRPVTTTLPSTHYRHFGDDPQFSENYNTSQTFNHHHLIDIPRAFTSNHQSNLSNQPPLRSNQSTRECVVCGEQRPITLFNERLSANCNHRHRQICTICVREHARVAINDRSNILVRCPEEYCTAQFEFNIIQHLLIDDNPQRSQYKQTVRQYENYLSQICIEMLPEFIWCAHGCGSGSQVTDEDIFICRNCGKKTCVHHKTKWHAGMTCAQYDLSLVRNKTAIATNQWLQINTKQCPNCAAKIEKNGGCNHMTCSNCRYEFCWECMADYNRIRKNGNSRHASYCSHYR